MLMLAMLLQAAAPAAVTAPCMAYAPKKGETLMLEVACSKIVGALASRSDGHLGMRIGQVDRFESVANEASGAIVVRAERTMGPCTAYVSDQRNAKVLSVACSATAQMSVDKSSELHGLQIGQVDDFASALNRATGALAIRATRNSKSRVYLVTQGGGGRPLVQDLTRELTQATGRYGDAGLGRATIDLSRFSETTRILVGNVEPGSRPAEVDVSRQIELALAAAARAPSGAESVGAPAAREAK